MKKSHLLFLILILIPFCDQSQDEMNNLSSKNVNNEYVYTLSELISPTSIVMDSKRIFIEDGTSVKIFDRGDFKQLRTIGREGQGPGEFIDNATCQLLTDKLLVSSSNKISFFTLSGDFIEDKKHTIFGSVLKSVNDKYVGYDWIFENDYVAYYLYDSNFMPVKELYGGRALIHPNGKRDLFEIFFYDTYGDKIIVAHREGFVIDIFDSNGNLIHSIKHDSNLVSFTKEDKEKIIQYWIDERGLEQWQIESLEKRTNFPDHYSPIQTCRLADGSIYIITYEKKNDKFKCLIFDLDGKNIKNTFIPLNMLAPNLASPFMIDGDNVYQIIYNYDSNEWTLHKNLI